MQAHILSLHTPLFMATQTLKYRFLSCVMWLDVLAGVNELSF